jgi:hypothetical protein
VDRETDLDKQQKKTGGLHEETSAKYMNPNRSAASRSD